MLLRIRKSTNSSQFTTPRPQSSPTPTFSPPMLPIYLPFQTSSTLTISRLIPPFLLSPPSPLTLLPSPYSLHSNFEVPKIPPQSPHSPLNVGESLIPQGHLQRWSSLLLQHGGAHPEEGAQRNRDQELQGEERGFRGLREEGGTFRRFQVSLRAGVK